jgi:HK97 family phage prohead protease
MPKFVFNNETEVNSYGFRIPNKGIDLKRFKANPIMLDQHYNSTRAVLGKWVNIKTEGVELSGDSEFDSEDADAAKIEGKVNRGYIKGASMGVTFNRDNMKLNPDGTWELTKCELYEVSIVAVPSNRSSLTLFAESGEILTEDDVKLSISELQADLSKKDTNIKIEQMDKIILSAVALTALGLTVAPENSNELNTAIEGLQAKLAAELNAHNATKAKLTALNEGQAKLMLSEAKLAGKITAEEETEMLPDAIANPAGTAKLLAKIPAKISLSKKVDNSTDDSDVKTMDDFEKLSDEAKLAFKTDSPDAYKALFK